MTKLTDMQVLEIRRLFKTKMAKQKDMAETFGVSVATINNIIGRRAYKHIVDEEIELNQDKQYSCRVQDDCNKCFKNSSLRSSHERRHTKPYKCTVCFVCYGTKDRMKFCERKHKSEIEDKKVILPDIFTLLDLSDKDVFNKKNLRVKYKKAVLKHHPDKGGAEELFIKVQGFKDKLYDLIDDDEMVMHYLDQSQKYTKYHLQKEKYDSQTALREEFTVVTKKMNEVRHLKGTVDEEFKKLRRERYKIKKDIVDEPSFYHREFGESAGFSWF
jgi:hypothetical protein